MRSLLPLALLLAAAAPPSDAGLVMMPDAAAHPVAFDLVGGLLVVRATVAGRPVLAVLDNGVGATLLDTGFARGAGVPLGPVLAPVVTPAGSLERRDTAPVSVAIAGQFATTRSLAAVDLRPISQAVGRPVSLIVGADVFSRLALAVQLDARRLRFAPSGAAVPPGAVAVPLAGARPAVSITVDGRPATVAVDLGYNGGVGLSVAAARRLGLSGRADRDGLSATLDGRVSAARYFQVGRITLGPLTLAPREVSVRPTLGADGDGVLGLGALAGHNFTLDADAGRLVLAP